MLQNYFKKFGHKCKLNLNSQFDKYFNNKSYFHKWFLKYSIISPKYILMRSHRRSYAALRNEMLDQLENYPLSIHPYSAITFYWEVFMMGVFFFWIIIMPYDIFVYLAPDSNWKRDPEYFEIILTIICLVDVARRFNTGYVLQHCDSEEIVLNVRRITFRYLETFFLIDLLSSLPSLMQPLYATSPKYCLFFEMFSFIKFFRLATLLRTAGLFLHFHGCNHNGTEIITFVIFLAIMVHWLSCCSILLGIIEEMVNPNAITWYGKTNILELKRIGQYTFCLHRTISLLSGAGYHFYLTEKSENDMVYIIFLVIFGWVMTCIIWAKTYEKIIAMRSSSARYEEMLNEISGYVKQKRVSATTHKQIETFYAYKYERSFFREQDTLNAVPKMLRQNISVHSSRMLQKIKFFRKLPSASIENIVSHLARDIVLSGHVIYKCGDLGNSIFFLLNGTVALFTGLGRELFHLDDGSQFGEVAIMINNGIAKSTVVAIETCEIYRLHSTYVEELAEYCPDLLHQLKQLATQRADLIDFTDERFARTFNRQFALRAIDDEGIDG